LKTARGLNEHDFRAEMELKTANPTPLVIRAKTGTIDMDLLESKGVDS
jgi:hypothetical protein